ncbi:unnamed protein product [Euphydryas editha]|uniref:Uncharacterized protein n=1 Tax=Euphydryas editha TaxID=104508 RepID=A0AAU9TAD7_EUPED|nr:unnamed protein product [Euphydryas editha]
MKVAFLTFVLGVCALQSTNAQCLYSGLPAAPAVVTAPAVITTNNVGATLADTLSLLTVSNLLAEKLPLGTLPIATVSPVVSKCGCGGYGLPYGPYIL